MNKQRQESFPIFFLKYLLPPLLLIVAVIGTIIIVKSKPKPVEIEVQRIIPDVQIYEAKSETIQLNIESQGTVVPRVETLLISEVSGTVCNVSPALYAGGFFKQGDVLLSIEDSDYVAAAANAKSVLAQMKLRYKQELALAEQAKQDWENMGDGEATNLVLHLPQLEKAAADVEFAQASLKVAKRNLAYTQVKAPYDGRVRQKYVDMGQSVSPKVSQLASIYSVDSAEIRLSLSMEEASFMNIPEHYAEEQDNQTKPKVKIVAEYGGKTYNWLGYLDRTEGVIDAKTRLTYVVAKVDDPYSLEKNTNTPPLKVGMFVKAIINGRELDNSFRVPNGALKPGNIVYTLTEENKLKINQVSVAHRGLNHIIISKGLSDGDRIIMTPLQAVIEGMELQPVIQK